jgi:hypothetical protein
MKRVLIPAMALICVSASCLAAEEPKEQKGQKEEKPSEQLVLIKMINRAKETEFKLLTAQEYKALDNELKLEAKIGPKAVALAEKDWKQDKELAKKMFPKSCIGDRKVTALGTFTDREKGEKRLQALQDQEDEKKDKLEKGGKKGEDKRSESMSAREELCSRAREMYEQKLGDLMKSAEKPAEKTEKAEKAEDGPALADKPADGEKAK